MKPCCSSLAESTIDTGRRGFSIRLPELKSEELLDRVPYIIFNAYDEGQEHLVQISASVPVSVSGKMGFRFCPWCGKRIAT